MIIAYAFVSPIDKISEERTSQHHAIGGRLYLYLHVTYYTLIYPVRDNNTLKLLIVSSRLTLIVGTISYSIQFP